jgi:hypothetical protein
MPLEKIIALWLATSSSIAAIVFFIAGWRSERTTRAKNPSFPRMRGCGEYVIGFFLCGCALMVFVAGSNDVLMRGLYAIVAILMFLNAVVYQKRMQQKMPEGPVAAGEPRRAV